LFAGATIALELYISRSWMGFAFRAVGEDEDAAATLGINAGAYKLAAFGIGTALAGLGGRPLRLLHAIHHRRHLRLHLFGDADGDGRDRRDRLDLGRRRCRNRR
jgi:branched-subunit amino acid ABC-type transport system permease component